MSAFAILGVISTIVALVAAATAVIAFTRASYAKATIEALRGDISDRNERIEFLEDENTRTKAGMKRLGGENEVMRDLVTNRAELAEYIAVAKEHEQHADQRHNDLLAVDEQILKSIQDIRALIGKP